MTDTLLGEKSRVRASAPANMILMGEYAVLSGAPAVMMTLPMRLDVTLSDEAVFSVYSDTYEDYQDHNGAILPAHVKLCRAVMDRFAAATKTPVFTGGIHISSEIPQTYGFGSSAALNAALIRALYSYYDIPFDFVTAYTIGHQAIHNLHGRGSGADLAAALFDKPFCVFDPQEKAAREWGMPFSVQAVYTGYKTPTPRVLEKVAATVKPDVYKRITETMADIAHAFIASPQYDFIRAYQFEMQHLGVVCDRCCEAVEILQEAGAAAKVSGSGLGDCIVGFSDQPLNIHPHAPFEFLSAKDICRAPD